MYVSMIRHSKNFQKIILQLASKQPRQPENSIDSKIKALPL